MIDTRRMSPGERQRWMVRHGRAWSRCRGEQSYYFRRRRIADSVRCAAPSRRYARPVECASSWNRYICQPEGNTSAALHGHEFGGISLDGFSFGHSQIRVRAFDRHDRRRYFRAYFGPRPDRAPDIRLLLHADRCTTLAGICHLAGIPVGSFSEVVP